MDIITINLIISSLILFFNFIDKLKCKHCQSGCFESDCIRTPATTPTDTLSLLGKD